MQHRRPKIVALILLLTALNACIPAMGESTRDERIGPGTAAEPSATPPGSPPPPAPAPPPPPPLPPAPPAPPWSVTQQGFVPFAQVEGLTLYLPAARIEHVAYHESSHDGARQMISVDTAVTPLILESRERGTGSHTAADIVADPAGEIRAPVTGTVIRGGSYVLYCDHRDYYVVIEPDDRPGWEVKLLHMTGLNVRKGQGVTAGRTVIAPGPRQLPFESQVDEFATSEPAWPHVHLEVVDPSIPDRPSPGGGC